MPKKPFRRAVVGQVVDQSFFQKEKVIITFYFIKGYWSTTTLSLNPPSNRAWAYPKVSPCLWWWVARLLPLTPSYTQCCTPWANFLSKEPGDVSVFVCSRWGWCFCNLGYLPMCVDQLSWPIPTGSSALFHYDLIFFWQTPQKGSLQTSA